MAGRSHPLTSLSAPDTVSATMRLGHLGVGCSMVLKTGEWLGRASVCILSMEMTALSITVLSTKVVSATTKEHATRVDMGLATGSGMAPSPGFHNLQMELMYQQKACLEHAHASGHFLERHVSKCIARCQGASTLATGITNGSTDPII